MDVWPEARCEWGSWAGSELPARLWAALVRTANPKSHSGRFFSKICGFVTLVVTYLPRDEQGPRALLHGCFCSCSHLSEKAAGQWVETPLFARLMKDKLGSQNLNNIFKGLDCNLGIWEECGDRPTPCVPFSKLQLLLLQQSVL